MNQDFHLIFSHIEKLQSRIPVVGDKLVYDLMNGINNSDDLIKFRQTQNSWDYIFSILTVSSDRYNKTIQQSELNQYFSENQKTIVKLIEEAFAILNINLLTLIETQESLRNTDVTIKKISDKLNNLEERVHKSEIYDNATRDFNIILGNWQAGKTYTNLPWLIQISLLAEEIFGSYVFIYELKTKDIKYFRKQLINEITKELKNRQQWEIGCFILADLLNSSCQEIIEKQDDINLFAWLFDLISIPKQRLKKQPHLFAISKTLQLATLPEEIRLKNPGQNAFDICRHLTNKIYRTVDFEELITSIIHEVANNSLARIHKSNSTANKRLDELAIAIEIKEGKPASQDNLTENTKYGLVLAGGGSRGAYQAGALQYIAELVESKQIQQPKIIAGTSIGALNGAILASHQPDGATSARNPCDS